MVSRGLGPALWPWHKEGDIQQPLGARPAAWTLRLSVLGQEEHLRPDPGVLSGWRHTNSARALHPEQSHLGVLGDPAAT